VIEREIPGAGKLTPADLHGISQKSCGVLNNMGPKIQWVQSFVTDDKIYCIYIAPDEATVREHISRDLTHLSCIADRDDWSISREDEYTMSPGVKRISPP